MKIEQATTKKYNKMLKNCQLFLLFLPCTLFAQYTDHRTFYTRIDTLEHLLATYPPTGDELVRTFRELAWGYLQTDKEKSMGYARKCIDLAAPLDKWNFVSNCYRLLGMHFYAFSQYDSAVVYYEKALDAVEQMRNFPKQFEENHIDDLFSSVYGSIGNLYNIQGKYHEAVEYYHKALRIFEKHDWKESQANARYNIGEMYLTMNNYEQAEINYTKMDAVAHELNDTMFIALAKLGLSVVFLNGNNYDKALECANAAYDYFFAHPEETTFKTSTLNVLAGIYLDGYNDDSRAEEYVRQALQIAEGFEIAPTKKSASLRRLSDIYLFRGEWRNAEQTALEALATDNSEPANTLALYEILAKTYAHLGNASKSNEYIDKLKELQSSWSNKHYQSAIREMEVKYETEKKETQIAALKEEKRLVMLLGIAGGGVLFLALAVSLLFWRSTVQKRRLSEKQKEFAEQQVKQLEQEKQLIATQAVLDGETAERSRLARDLHDGLGSKLTGVRLHLQELRQGAELVEADAKQYNLAMEMLDEATHEMRRVSHNLMPDALTRYGLKQAVDDFCRSMSPNIVFDWYGTENRLNPKLELLIYRSIHELVNNALKYSGTSQIMVQIMQDTDSIGFTVQDDGCGFDPSATTKGTGLQNVRTRVASFGGNIQIDTKAGEGTEINVKLRTAQPSTQSITN